MDGRGVAGRRAAQSGRFEADLVAAVRLGLVEVAVGRPVHVGIGGQAAEGDAADAHRKLAQPLAREEFHLADAPPYPFGNQPGLRGVGAGKKDRELLAANAPDNVGAAQLALDRLGDQFQRLVAAVMAEAVIDGLEMIGIDDQEGACVDDRVAAA